MKNDLGEASGSGVTGTRSRRRWRDELFDWECDDYGPVTCEELSNMRRNSVILFESELYPGKVSEWSLRAEPGRHTKYYICVLCRRLQDRGKRMVPPAKFGPPARILVRDGRFLSHPDNPRTPHICGFADNPLSDRAAVLTRRAMIRARAEISEDGTTPREKFEQLLKRFREDEKYAHLTEEEITKMENMVLGKSLGRSFSDSSIARSLYLNRRKLITSKADDKPRRIYECPIVGCSFITFAGGMINVHLSEIHRIVEFGDHFESGNSLSTVSKPDIEGDVDLNKKEMTTVDSSMIFEETNVLDDEGLSDGCDDSGPVLYEAFSNQRRKSVILFKSVRHPNKISEWILKLPVTDNKVQHYTCALCRRIRDKGKRQNVDVQYPPVARIAVRDGRFLVHPDYPKTPHICDFENNPLSDCDSVLSRRSLAGRSSQHRRSDQQSNLPPCSTRYSFPSMDDSQNSKSRVVYEVDESENWQSYDDESTYTSNEVVYDELDEAAKNAEKHAASTSEFSVEVNRSGYTSGANRDGDQSRIYNCTIVGCEFKTSAISELDSHLQEHELMDEEAQSYEIYETNDGASYVEAVGMIVGDNEIEPLRKRCKLAENEVVVISGDIQTDDFVGEVPHSAGDVNLLRQTVKEQIEELNNVIDSIEPKLLLELRAVCAKVMQIHENADCPQTYDSTALRESNEQC